MKVLIKNLEFFEWEIPEETLQLMQQDNMSIQDAIDHYFDPNGLESAREGDTYYELVETREE